MGCFVMFAWRFEILTCNHCKSSAKTLHGTAKLNQLTFYRDGMGLGVDTYINLPSSCHNPRGDVIIELCLQSLS